MAKRGPKPQPTKLRIAHGNPGKRPIVDVAKGPSPSRPEMPAWLGAVAQAKWRSVVPQIEATGVLAAVDVDIIAAYCVACQRLQVADEAIAKADLTISRGTGGLAPHPLIAIQDKAIRTIEKLGALLGLNPHSRRGWLDGGDDGDGEVDPIDELLDDEPA